MSLLSINPVKSSRGFTLLEVLVVSTLTGLIAIPLMMFIYKGLQSYAFLQAQSNTSTELSTLSERIVKVLRGATAVVNAGSNTLTVDGYFSPADVTPDQITYYISGTDLDIGVIPPSGTAPNYTYPAQNQVVTTTRVDLTMGGVPLFTYYDSNGNQLPSGFQNSQIYAIGVYVAANPSPGQVGVPISIKTLATLRNFKTNL
jgi:prepilin-type N-terminal cleavage/methylation domain-containing protein